MKHAGYELLDFSDHIMLYLIDWSMTVKVFVYLGLFGFVSFHTASVATTTAVCVRD